MAIGKDGRRGTFGHGCTVPVSCLLPEDVGRGGLEGRSALPRMETAGELGSAMAGHGEWGEYLWLTQPEIFCDAESVELKQK